MTEVVLFDGLFKHRHLALRRQNELPVRITSNTVTQKATPKLVSSRLTMSKPKPSQQKQRTTHHDRIPEAVLHMIWHNAENTPKRGYASLMGCNGSSS